MPKRQVYRFDIAWNHLAGEDPEHIFQRVGIIAPSVPTAIAKFLNELTAEGEYDKRSIRILEVQNRDIP